MQYAHGRVFQRLTSLLLHACGLTFGQRPEGRKVVLPLLHQQCKTADSRGLHSFLTLFQCCGCSYLKDAITENQMLFWKLLFSFL